LVVGLVLAPGAAHAGRGQTRDAFDRLEEILEMRQEDGLLSARNVLPAIVVSATPRYEESRGWFGPQALAVLGRGFGEGVLRVCEACMGPRTSVTKGRLEQSVGPVSLEEITRLDDRYRGESARARSAIWIDETASGVALRIVHLRSGAVIFAQNVDPDLQEYRGAARSFRLAEELERRTRGDSLTHALFDAGIYPGQHFSFEWVEQWGDTNNNLTGIVLSTFDPVLGLGFGYHRALEFQNMLVGGKLVLSIPTAIAQSATDSDIEVIDPIVTGVFVARYPLWGSNYAALLTASTSGRIAFGIAFLNTSFIPVIP